MDNKSKKMIMNRILEHIRLEDKDYISKSEANELINFYFRGDAEATGDVEFIFNQLKENYIDVLEDSKYERIEKLKKTALEFANTNTVISTDWVEGVLYKIVDIKFLDSLNYNIKDSICKFVSKQKNLPYKRYEYKSDFGEKLLRQIEAEKEKENKDAKNDIINSIYSVHKEQNSALNNNREILKVKLYERLFDSKVSDPFVDNISDDYVEILMHGRYPTLGDLNRQEVKNISIRQNIYLIWDINSVELDADNLFYKMECSAYVIRRNSNREKYIDTIYLYYAYDSRIINQDIGLYSKITNEYLPLTVKEAHDILGKAYRNETIECFEKNIAKIAIKELLQIKKSNISYYNTYIMRGIVLEGQWKKCEIKEFTTKQDEILEGAEILVCLHKSIDDYDFYIYSCVKESHPPIINILTVEYHNSYMYASLNYEQECITNNYIAQ